MALQKSPTPQTGQGEMEVNYQDCEELDKGPGGLFFFSTKPTLSSS